MYTGNNSGRSRVAAVLCAVMLAIALVPFSSVRAFAAEEEGAQYEIYPTPHSVVYGGDTVSLESTASLVVESGIDADTIRRLDETLALQTIPGINSDVIPSKPGLSVLVGVKGSGGLVDQHAKDLVKSKKLAYSDDVFTKTDAYVLSVIKDANGAGADEIIVLGKDTDAAFYGLTSLYRIFQQINNAHVQTLTIADYADVQTRGFIEGYYGNPWSTQNRVDLMTWGGYNKLNAYFYAPKDDPKHNEKWFELYSEEELASKIEPLAKAGNESKVRFIYALHPFMNNPITSGNYDEQVEKLKAKFTQVIDHGVRQIAILADDAADQGSDLYTKLLKDMTAWIQNMQNQKNDDGTLKYPGLKDTIVFCPVHYGSSPGDLGESWYADLPENISVINTGGRVWGAASHSFFTQFKKNTGGRAAFMWMNFPCSDNDKDALHMANHENFLEPGVQPGDLTGLVMNPMQQSEPSKVAIFLNADYSWNLWTSAEHGDRVWDDAFSYAEHNSPIATEASTAMRAISQHMRRMYGGGATWEGRESAEVKDTLIALQNAVRLGNPTAEQVAATKKIYTDIKPAVETFRARAATQEMLRQMEPWLGAFNDLIDAAAFYSDAMSAYLQGNNDAMIDNFQVAEGKLSSYNKNHGFRYVDHDEFAKVGKAYLMPTVAAMQAYLDPKVKMALDPDAKFFNFITSRTDTPEGSVASVFDGDSSTGVTYKNPNSITTGTYAGVVSNKPFDADKVTFVLGDASGKDWFDAAKLQYTTDPDAFSAPASAEWTDVPSTAELTSSPVTVSDMNLTGITGLRLIATRDNSRDAWFVVKEITVGDPVVPETSNPVMEGASASASVGTYQSYSPDKGIDGNIATNYWSNENTAQDTVYTVTFDGTKNIKHILLVQGSTDKLDKGVVEYTADGGATWKKVADVAAGTITGETSTQQWTLSEVVEATGIRVSSTAATSYWWKIYEFSADDGSGIADRTELQAAVNEAKALDQSQYTVFTWQVLEGNLTVAQNVLDDEMATQEAVDSAKANLRRAIDGLQKADEPVEPIDPQPDVPTETLVDMAVLNGTVAAAEKLEKAGQAGYSADTWDAFTAALNAARTLQEEIEPGTLAADVQESVDQASETLWAAMKALRENPESPKDPEDIDPLVPATPEGAHEGAPQKPADLKRTPDTGLHLAGYVMAAGLWLLLGSALVVTSRKRRA